jgi:hypothetical protein
MCGVSECDREALILSRPWAIRVSRAMKKIKKTESDMPIPLLSKIKKLTTWSRVILENLKSRSATTKSFAFHQTENFTTMHCVLSKMNPAHTYSQFLVSNNKLGFSFFRWKLEFELRRGLPNFPREKETTFGFRNAVFSFTYSTTLSVA